MSEASDAMTGGRVHALDGLRGIAALAVALSHYHELRALLAPSGHLNAESIFTASYLFVDFFFVLSGFVLARASSAQLVSPRAGIAFAIRRFGRLWPLHAAMLFVIATTLAAYAALTGSTTLPVPTVNMDAPSALASLVLVQGLGFQSGLIWNWPAWSIACELWVNLLMALLVILAPRRFLWIASALVVGSALALIVGSDDNMFRVQSLAFARCMYGYFLGVILFHAVERVPSLRFGQDRDVSFWRPLEIAMLALSLTIMMISADNKLSFAAPLFFVPVILVFAQSPGPIAARLGSGVLRALGQWSYSIYLVHAPLLILMLTICDLTARFEPVFAADVRSALGNLWVQDFAFLTFAAAVIFLSRLTFNWIEEPSRLAFNAVARAWSHSNMQRPALGEAKTQAQAPRIA